MRIEIDYQIKYEPGCVVEKRYQNEMTSAESNKKPPQLTSINRRPEHLHLVSTYRSVTSQYIEEQWRAQHENQLEHNNENGPKVRFTTGRIMSRDAED